MLFPPAVEHQGQPTPKFSKTLGVRGRQTLSPGNYSEIGIPEVLDELVFQCLVGLINKFRFSNHNFLDKHLQLIYKYILSLPGLLGLVVKISNQ